MSNIDKQVLREEFQQMQDHYSDPADRDRQVIYIAAEALLDELEAADALNKHLELAIRKAEGCSEALRRKAESAEKRIAELEARELKPAKGEVLVTVTGFTGCGKSAIAGEIEIAMKAIGVPVQWANGDAEKRMTGADWLTAIEMYNPSVRIVEVNVPRAAAAGKGE